MTERQYGRIYLDTWDSPAWANDRALGRGPLGLLHQLGSQRKISQAGVLPYQPRVWARQIGCTEDELQAELDVLVERSRVVIDLDTEELLIVDHVEREKLGGTWKIEKGAINACSSVASPALRLRLAEVLECLLPHLREEAREPAEVMIDVLDPDGIRSASDCQSIGSRRTRTRNGKHERVTENAERETSALPDPFAVDTEVAQPDDPWAISGLSAFDEGLDQCEWQGGCDKEATVDGLCGRHAALIRSRR